MGEKRDQDTTQRRGKKPAKTPAGPLKGEPPKRTTKHGQLQWARSTFRTKR